MPTYWPTTSTIPTYCNYVVPSTGRIYVGAGTGTASWTTDTSVTTWIDVGSTASTTSFTSSNTAGDLYVVGNRVIAVPRGMAIQWVDQGWINEDNDPQWAPARRVESPRRRTLRAPAAPAIIRSRQRDEVAERHQQREAAHSERQARALRVQRERAEAEQARQRAIIEQERQRVAWAANEARGVARTEANARARALLLEHLTPEQRRMVEQHFWFVVEGGRSKQKYRINLSGVAGNIHQMHGERATHQLCCHCDHAIPAPDHHLAQKLMLEFAEDDFLRLANRHAI
jgi:hypothetical protein